MFPRAVGKRSFSLFVLGHDENAAIMRFLCFLDSPRILHFCLVLGSSCFFSTFFPLPTARPSYRRPGCLLIFLEYHMLCSGDQ
jgi:hypothetical protein